MQKNKKGNQVFSFFLTFDFCQAAMHKKNIMRTGPAAGTIPAGCQEK